MTKFWQGAVVGAGLMFILGTFAMDARRNRDERVQKSITADLHECRRMLAQTDEDFKQCMSDLKDAMGPKSW